MDEGDQTRDSGGDDNVLPCQCNKCSDCASFGPALYCQSIEKAKTLCRKAEVECITELPNLVKVLDKEGNFLNNVNIYYSISRMSWEILLFAYFDTLRVNYSDPPSNE